MDVQRQRCGRCKVNLPIECFKVKRCGNAQKQCLECNVKHTERNRKYRCEHGRQRAHCRECGGKFFCEHGRQRYKCRECGGSAICEHGRERQICRECGGAAFCEHGRQRSRCRECGGAGICEHGRRRHSCRECGGAAFCEHSRLRQYCRECGGACICEHDRRRHNCHECGGSQICEHGHNKKQCRECDPAGHLRNLVAARIYGALHTDKDRGSIEYLGCSIEEFKAHIESTFLLPGNEGMTWENHGKAKIGGPRVWNIDHIVPIKFETVPGVPPTLEEVAARLHWTNTQAMWAEENIAKGNRYVGRAGENPDPEPEPEKQPALLTDDELCAVLADFGF